MGCGLLCLFGLPPKSPHNLLDVALQNRQVPCGSHSNLPQIQAEVLMHEDVSQGDEFRPLHVGVPGAKCRRQPAGGLADDLQVVNHPNLQHLVAPEGLFPCATKVPFLRAPRRFPEVASFRRRPRIESLTIVLIAARP